MATSASAALVAGGSAGAAPGLAPGNYIVRSAPGGDAAAAVTAAGGTVLVDLPIVDGVDAHLGAAAAQTLAAEPTLSVTPDLTLKPLGQDYSAATTAPQLARLDAGPLWSPTGGAGVGVALIDTGVADTPGIDSSHLVRSPDFSGTGGPADGYGHGTFMAGLIAGNGAGGTGAVPGVAPGVTLVAVKVAGSDGSTTLSKVLEGIAWTLSNRNAYHIQVLSLSFGADFSGPIEANPLDQAVEAAWDDGVAVVASSGNAGAGHVTSPGDDPAVITVGAETTVGAVVAPSWSGSSASKPDVLAPGVSVVSLRDPGSFVDVNNPSARVGDNYFVGSGTSMSTALTAGAAALLLADHAAATPDQVKAALLSAEGPAISGPAGAIDVAGADASSAWVQTGRPNPTPPGQDGSLPPGPAAGGSGSLQLTTGRWDTGRWDTGRWDTGRWDTGRWDTVRWDTVRWDTVRWDTVRWDTVRWDTGRWDTVRWDTGRWDTVRWDTGRWDAAVWADQAWGQ